MSRSAVLWAVLAGTSTTLVAQAGDPAAATAIGALLRELDAAFGRGDTAAYFAGFAADRGSCLDRLQRRHQLERAFAASTGRERSSALLGEPRQLDAHTIVRVRYTVTLRCPQGGPVPTAAFHEECVLALRAERAGHWTPVLEVEAAPDAAGVHGDTLRCPACNYEIGGGAGWLCVPLRSDRANAIEAASFYRLGSDVVCDTSVRIDAVERAPDVVARELAKSLTSLADTTIGAATGWLPPAHTVAPPPGLRGARLAVDLADGARVVIHVAAFGRLQHVLLVRGSANGLLAEAKAIDALLASYRLLEHDRDLAHAAAEPLLHHTGGALHGGNYENHRYGVSLAGEPGWTAALRCGGTAFRVVWTSPAGSRLWLTGHAVPPGMARWCRTTADRWLAELCGQLGLQVVGDAPGCAEWKVDPACGDASRLVRATPPGVTRPRWVRLLMHDDLLLVVDGAPVDAADEGAVQRMLHAVQRRR